MNQILYTSNGKPNGPLPIKVIVRFFAICLIVLGVIFVGESSYGFFSGEIYGLRELDSTVPEINFAKDRKCCNYFSYS